MLSHGMLSYRLLSKLKKWVVCAASSFLLCAIRSSPLMASDGGAGRIGPSLSFEISGGHRGEVLRQNSETPVDKWEAGQGEVDREAICRPANNLEVELSARSNCIRSNCPDLQISPDSRSNCPSLRRSPDSNQSAPLPFTSEEVIWGLDSSSALIREKEVRKRGQ